MIIYKKDNTQILDAPITKAAKRNWQLMSANNIALSFELSDYIDIPKGSYIIHDGQTFYMIRSFAPEDHATKDGYKYAPVFDGPEYWLGTRNIFYIAQGYREAVFTDTTNAAGFGQIIIDCANVQLPGFTWLFYVHGDVDGTVAKTLAFKGESILDAVTMVAEALETEWWAIANGTEITLHFGKLEVGSNLTVRVGEIIKSLPPRRGDDTNYGTRFYVFGGTTNLTADYGQVDQGGTTNHISEIRLRLPNNQAYIDAWEGLEEEDVVEQIVFFEDVFPTSEDTITAVTTVERPIDDSEETFTAYIIEASASPFAETDIIPGETIMVVFSSGVLLGREYEVSKVSDFANKKFELIGVHEDDGDGGLITMPGGVLIPAVGDTFSLTGVKLPDARATEAEQELLAVGTAHAAKNSNDTQVYECPTDAIYCQNNDIDLPMGQKVLLPHPRFGPDGRESRLQGFVKALWNPYMATYTFGDNTTYSITGKLETSIKSTIYADRLGVNSGSGIHLISKYDTTVPTDYNAYAASRAQMMFAQLQKDVVFQNLLLSVNGEKYLETLNNYIALHKSFGSPNASGGMAGSGFIYDATTGKLSVDTIEARKKAIFNELEVRKMTSIGGMQVASHGNAIITAVTDGGSYWRCEYNIDNGEFSSGYTEGSFIRMQTFKPTGSRYYWRKVTSVGADYFNLSKTTCDAGSDEPLVGDNTVGWGHETDTARQSVVLTSAIDRGYLRFYDGIDSFNMEVNTQGVKVLRTAIGYIGDIVDEDFGQLEEDGLFARNAYIKGRIEVTGGNAATKDYADDGVRAVKVGGANMLTNSDFRDGDEGFAINDGATISKSNGTLHFGDYAYFFSPILNRYMYREAIITSPDVFVFAPHFMLSSSGTVRISIMDNAGTVLHYEDYTIAKSVWYRGEITAALAAGTYRVAVECRTTSTLMYNQHWYLGVGNKAPAWSVHDEDASLAAQGALASKLGVTLEDLETMVSGNNTLFAADGSINDGLILVQNLLAKFIGVYQLTAANINVENLIVKKLRTSETPGRVEIDDVDDTISVVDDTGNVCVGLQKRDIPEAGSSWFKPTTIIPFVGAGTTSVDPAATNIQLVIGSVTIPAGKQKNIQVPPISLSVDLGTGTSGFLCDIYIEGVTVAFGQLMDFNHTTGDSVFSIVGQAFETKQLEPGDYEIKFRLNYTNVTSGTVTLNASEDMYVGEIYAGTQLGAKGLNVYDEEAYANLNASEKVFEFMTGNYGFRISDIGIKKTTDGGETWTTANL